MKSNIAEALSLRYPPLAFFFVEELPPDADEKRTVCSMMLVAGAAQGKTVVLTRKNCSCHGAVSGFALEPTNPDSFPGGAECHFRFLSSGNKDWEQGRAVLQKLKEGGAPKIMIEEFSEGEGFLKTPEHAKYWTYHLPQIVHENRCLVIKPLGNLKPGETPKTVSFLVNPNQLSALTILANYSRFGTDHVRIPFGAGCTCFGLYPFDEAEKENPRAVVGLTDMSARFYINRILGDDILSFTVPFKMFEEMESNVHESFLTRYTWKMVTKDLQSKQK